jgi:hypothetical protein
MSMPMPWVCYCAICSQTKRCKTQKAHPCRVTGNDHVGVKDAAAKIVQLTKYIPIEVQRFKNFHFLGDDRRHLLKQLPQNQK